MSYITQGMWCALYQKFENEKIIKAMNEMNTPKEWTVKESFIKEAHSMACPDWKLKIEAEFPELFNGKYAMGNTFNDQSYILAQVEPSRMAIISMKDGNRFTDPVEVHDPKRITEAEFRKLCGGGTFKLDATAIRFNFRSHRTMGDRDRSRFDRSRFLFNDLL